MILHPRPSPIAATMYQLRDMGVDAIIMHGPSGCCFRTARLLEIDGIRVFTTAMNENDFIFGATEKLKSVIDDVIAYLRENDVKESKESKESKDTSKERKLKIGIVGTCASMIIGEDITGLNDEYSDNEIIIPVDIHSGLADNTIGAIRAMESAMDVNLISEEEFNRQVHLLNKATEVEKTKGMAKQKYLQPTYDDDIDEVMREFKEKLINSNKANNKELKSKPVIVCILNAKKETSYLFSHPILEINKAFKNNAKIINIANLDDSLGFEKVRKDAKNVLSEFKENNVKIDYITGGLDEYAITGLKATEILEKLSNSNNIDEIPDIVFVSGVPHALDDKKLKDIKEKNPNVITIGISDGPRLYHPIKDMYDYGIIELDAHAKVLGKKNIVKSRFGELINYTFQNE
ncbi:Ni-sirohydrochlorin a,c-diamide reductive cyclase catalytic subunit [Methanococcus voltae]|uniref:Methanogenesis marker 13 metalloprotein n=1 Tax=Methanococcus voltae (strain ATCC BAA-1334 / A3) TaxID=456320 RepID=D7DR08_METV3|nr:Ni-sirohydrochlorin a,c-diamide reductive cyclase catalytic subunit [Methanococcus voltae]MCS3900945.1 putative methanogenesis marker 13 metalloprotein [Methanococcus voltae]